MAASSTRTSTNIPIRWATGVVVLTADEWIRINIALESLLERCDWTTPFQQAAGGLAAAADERRRTAVDRYVAHSDERGPLVTLELDVHDDATDAELLVAARRALAADTEAVTA